MRRAIVAAFARLELALEAAGAPRGPGEAPLEYVGRVLGELEVPPEPLDELASLFEQAKFSLHALDEGDREAAIEALEAVREALRVRRWIFIAAAGAAVAGAAVLAGTSAATRPRTATRSSLEQSGCSGSSAGRGGRAAPTSRPPTTAPSPRAA